LSVLIPFTTETNPETGFYNSKFGIWLFIASEIMLFGGLFSAYILIRSSATDWPANPLSITFGSVNTFMLVASTYTMYKANKEIHAGNFSGFKTQWLLTLGFGLAFLTIKSFEYYGKISHGDLPEKNLFLALYFVLTFIHVLHVLGGMLVNLYHVFPGKKLWDKNPEMFKNRIEVSAIYWYFVDSLWLFVLFPILYLT